MKDTFKDLKFEKKLELLISAIEDVYPSTKQLIWRSFLRGVFVGLGTTIGASVVIALLTYFIGQLRFIPVLQDFFNQVPIQNVLPK